MAIFHSAKTPPANLEQRGRAKGEGGLGETLVGNFSSLGRAATITANWPHTGCTKPQSGLFSPTTVKVGLGKLLDCDSPHSRVH